LVKSKEQTVAITKHCGSWLLYNVKNGDARRFFCGLVTCDRPECKHRFYIKRLHLVQDVLTEYNLDKFFTLTMSRDMPLEIAWKGIAKVWNKFRTVIRRIYPSFVYVAVLESHSPYRDGEGCDDGQESFLGYPHVHGFTSTWIPQADYSRHFSACGGGDVAWVERVSGDVGEYVLKQLGKYVGKQNLIMAKLTMGKCKRTIWRSVGLKTKREKQNGNDVWAIVKQNCFDIDGTPCYTICKDGDEFVVKLTIRGGAYNGKIE